MCSPQNSSIWPLVFRVVTIQRLRAESKRQPVTRRPRRTSPPRVRIFEAQASHHSRAPTRIAEALDEGLHDLRAVLRLSLRQQGVLDGRSERGPFNALGGPVGGNFLAAHAPDFLGIGLKEDAEEALAKLVDDPVFEGFGIACGTKSGFGERQHAADRFEQAELGERIRDPLRASRPGHLAWTVHRRRSILLGRRR